MGYRTIDTRKRPARLTETLGVTKRGISFNRLMRQMMGIAHDSKIAFLVSDDGNIALYILDKDSPTGGKLIKPYKGTDTLMVISANLARHTVPGRYRITGRDGAFWLTDIKYKDA